MKNSIPAGTQLLVLPINRTAVTAGYKSAAYKKQLGFEHYGYDSYSEDGNATVFALGDGEVIAAGLDGADGDYSGMGWVTVIRYNKVYIPASGAVGDLVATTFHHQAGSLQVRAGQKVNRNTVLGLYGNTGGTTVSGGRMGSHLHLQLDSDAEHPLYCYGISGRTSKILKGGTVDSTANPFCILTAKTSPPNNQRAVLKTLGWAEDWSMLPAYESLVGGGDGEAPAPDPGDCGEQLARAQAEIAELNVWLTAQTKWADAAAARIEAAAAALEKVLAALRE